MLLTEIESLSKRNRRNRGREVEGSPPEESVKADLMPLFGTAVTSTVALEAISLYRLRGMCPNLLDRSY
jgi:hypothetical protein